MDAELLRVLVCPKSRQPLVYFEAEGFLLSPAAKLRFPIDRGVPVLLVEEAIEVSEADFELLMKQAKEQGLTGS